MKKILLIVASALMLLMVTSCSLDSIFKKDPGVKSLTGLLVEQQMNDDYAGSHLLIDEKGEVISTLRSLSINLSGDNYLNNKVQVMGKKNVDDDVFEIDGISVLEVIDPATSNREFIEYKNTDLGFKIQYYSDWTVTENGNQVTFVSPSENQLEDLDKVVITQSPFQYELPEVESYLAEDVLVEEYPTDTPVLTEEALKDYAAKNGYSNPESLMHKVGVDKMDALQIQGEGENVEYFLYRSGFIYNIEFIESKTATITENKNIFEEMLAEIQFTGFTVEAGDQPVLDDDTTVQDTDSPSDIVVEPIDPSKMAAFESSIYHFSAQYPKDWYYAGKKGTEGDVLHHYGFSDSSLDEEAGATNELISLDVISSLQADSQSSSNSIFTVYVNVDSRTYRVSGNEAYKDVILSMAKSIASLQEPVL